MKKTLLLLVVLIALLGGAFFYMKAAVEELAKVAVERIGSEATGTTVVLGEVEILPIGGRGVLRGFHMTKPGGFGAEEAFAFEAVDLTIDLLSLLQSPVVIKAIIIEKPRISYRIGESQDSLETRTAFQGREILIESLELLDGSVQVSAPGLTDQRLSAPLPDIHLANIGEDGRGATPGELARQATAAVVTAAEEALKSLNLDELLEDSREKLKELLE